MINAEKLEGQFSGHIKIKRVSPDVYQVKAPFYHEDGDMMDIFLEGDGNKFVICDFGASLMRLSYSFDIDTNHKEKIFSKVLANNGVTNHNGNILLPSSYETFFDDLMQYQTAISKITNLDILRREQVASLFFEYLSNYVNHELTKHFSKIEAQYHPTNEEYHVADYAILDHPERPVYILGVKDNLQAARASAFCLKLETQKELYTSIAVHENPDSLSSRDRNALTNAVDKQYTSFNDFKAECIVFIKRAIARSI